MSHSEQHRGLTYRDAGVDIDAGEALVERIRGYAASTRRQGVLAGLGGFGALFELPLANYRRPVLVSGTDGVGTKLRVAQAMNRHDSIGIDLVAMCVNDIVVQGAEPLFFLDYFATGRLHLDTAEAVIKGIADGCAIAGCSLVGGETAEMPGMYERQDYDLAGFAVGIVEKDDILDGSAVQVDDVVLGLASTGPHSNGYSLIRRILVLREANLGEEILDAAGQPTTLGAALLTPTRIYVRPLLALLRSHQIHALAHITGGGLTGNVPRVLPSGVHARIDLATWPRPPIFDWLQVNGDILEPEMLRTFNCGVGMVAVLPETAVDTAIIELADSGIAAWPIGRIVAGDGPPSVQYVS